MSEANGNAEAAQQQPQQPQGMVMMPNVQFGIGETPDRKQVLVTFQIGGPPFPFQETLIIAFDPNNGLTFARQLRAKCKELNSGLVIARPQQHMPPGTKLPGGGIDLSALRSSSLVDDEDDDEDEPGDSASASAIGGD